ncbi:hypothetical protein L3V83_00110 [Thiotrichales bacterium 19X7-9]|nr:hypothetical protein [Thiotrichales bacterium 19X7-9]MCF6774960.1 hypothetical protein [Thiotrichales bacterium 19X7-9]
MLNQIKKIILCTLLPFISYASPTISLMPSHIDSQAKLQPLIQILKENKIKLEKYRNIEINILPQQNKLHLMYIFLFLKNRHSVILDTIPLSENFQQVGPADFNVNPNNLPRNSKLTSSSYKCQHPNLKVIIFYPKQSMNNIRTKYVNEVYEAAIQNGYFPGPNAKEQTLLFLHGNDATAKAYLDAMTCPKLIGNFYDGDGLQNSIYTTPTTSDPAGLLTSKQIETVLKGKLRYKVTNIWVACQSGNNPMQSAMTVSAEAQKYASGLDGLYDGPGDYTGACTIDTIMNKNNKLTIQQVFTKCHQEAKTKHTGPNSGKTEPWYFGGQGANMFGK